MLGIRFDDGFGDLSESVADSGRGTTFWKARLDTGLGSALLRLWHRACCFPNFVFELCCGFCRGMPRKGTPVIKEHPGQAAEPTLGELLCPCGCSLLRCPRRHCPSLGHLCSSLQVLLAFPAVHQHSWLSSSTPGVLEAPAPSLGSSLPFPPLSQGFRADLCLFLSLSPSSCSFFLPLFTFFFHLLPSVLLTSGYFGLSFSLSVW